ncbi:MAG: DNA repair protein RecO [Spirochaetaceae bacterium]|nr:DNA repair protein RecO [Spirochaetaceae bacterium]
MDRNTCEQAIVLKTRKDGDSNRNLTLLSVDNGIYEIRAFRFRTSKTAPKAYLFQEGMFYLYNNPVKKQYSLKDVSLISSHDSIREDYEAIIVASLMSEFILCSANDDMSNIYRLLATSLDLLEDSTIEKDIVLIQFFLRMIREHGLIENFSNCPVCNKKYSRDEILHFSQTINVPCCSDCEQLPNIILQAKARKYLSYSLNMSFEDSILIKLNDTTIKRIKHYMLAWASIIMGHQFKSIGSQIN